MGCSSSGVPRARVVNIGCRVNRVESDRIEAELARAGFALDETGEADLIIINTCAVTGEAEAKTRKAVRRALVASPSARVIATGCSVNLNASALAALSDRVIVEPVKERVCARAAQAAAVLGAAPCAPSAVGSVRGTRARVGVKVQDGCNRRCSYCIVWRARGPERSVPVAAVTGRVRELAAAGVAEVVLTGVNLGAWAGSGRAGGTADIADLLEAVLGETDIARVRLSSIEPMDVSGRLLAVMAHSSRRVAPYLHLPLQSGCSATLRRMGRPYSAQDFAELARRSRRSIAGVALSCDIIAGFPGETDEEFEASFELCARIGFSRMHVFRYSARPGTPAAAASGRIEPAVAAGRARRLRALAAEMTDADARSRIGTREIAVVERARRARLGSYHPILIDGPLFDQRLGGRRDAAPIAIADVDIVDIDENGMLHGRIANIPAEGHS
ncbi:RNA modification enzyme, MiaB family [Coriobacterium glomerans PW2]|uniref:RNA modification enzyme, MiaB family n=1 Tax=Coriobacterium glomerans (strain ATCC 49209 / DSM 20642 / JCM 10262 / PW2) TaxID=700015 RepID=F2N7Q2_CORGP|nr:MiaB/RimO family radical SAM methylthiotransferase [Coriobacterium glomerans]AEB06944.1 RNA modification enzyme, MiaB family [Coriobacterium glomerans PW2]